ncbi:mechanosensitive ion channel family protein [Bradyrhizobium sp. CCBAU 25338]|uniref:mechanosensitive ion channel family protein n=1 Tax=Bradyrhizobium sp. CCBAU 25338 TaxID=1641877 RepID=UPI0023039D71|nr:hypothetical protein [Bradyrhizobium sp. CCBAU 25338]
MTVNFDTLRASLVLYGLNAIYAILLLAVGWYLSGAMQRFVTRVLSGTHRVDPLVTLFVGSLARYGVLAVVGIACCSSSASRPRASSPCWAPHLSPLVWRCRVRFPISLPA